MGPWKCVYPCFERRFKNTIGFLVSGRRRYHSIKICRAADRQTDKQTNPPPGGSFAARLLLRSRSDCRERSPSRQSVPAPFCIPESSFTVSSSRISVSFYYAQLLTDRGVSRAVLVPRQLSQLMNSSLANLLHKHFVQLRGLPETSHLQ